MLRLEHGERIPDDVLLAAYKAAELWGDTIALLIEMGHYDEAVALAVRRLTNSPATIAFANLLRTSGENDRAIQFVDDRLWESEGKQARDDLAYLAWLRTAYAETGQPDQALETSLRLFKLQPGFAKYRDVKDTASLPGQEANAWDNIRADLIKQLRDRAAWGDLVEIYLADDSPADALAALKQLEQKEARPTHGNYGYGYGWSGIDGYRQRVAAAVSRDAPDEAIRLYRTLADHGIEQRNREHYRQAAGYLAQVKQILDAGGRSAEWQEMITSVRDEHRRLRALKEELITAGLSECYGR